ncbi:MAG TPA: tRNA pseudouridine(55) synthase TruB [Gemmataceae bacterium]|nr:tRNA pseudouridine(55) synthase TruB [Gemmataceae bacterium]
MPKPEFHGLLVLDKPGGMTSRSAVNVVQKWFGRKTKIGHTGTLDPLATGVLVICLGQATRLAEYVQAMRKTYRSTFLLGSRSDTDDSDGTIIASAPAGFAPPSRQEIEVQLRSLVGEIDQVPPAFSAALSEGNRAYDLARKGTAAELKPRRILVYHIEILDYVWPRLEVEVRCGKGTYIRSLARDLGEKLGCGGLVEKLRRLNVGPFTADAAIPIDWSRPTPPSDLANWIRPMAEAVVELPKLQLDADQAKRFRHGQTLRLAASLSTGEIAVLDSAGNFLGTGLSESTNNLKATKVFSA